MLERREHAPPEGENTMATLPLVDDARVVHDARSGAIRSWFKDDFRPQAKANAAPQAIAHAVLAENAELFRWHRELADIVERTVIDAPGARSVRYFQTFKKLPVDASDIVVNIDDAGRLNSIYNDYHYDIPQQLDPQETAVTREGAERTAERLFARYREVRIAAAALIVYRYEHVENHDGKPRRGAAAERTHLLMAVTTMQVDAAQTGFKPVPGQYFLAWDLRVETEGPKQQWRILIDAASGHVLNAIDLAQYDSGTAHVFDPNPIVTSGNTALRHDSPAATINAQRVPVTVERLAPPSMGALHLQGTFVAMAEEESPAVAAPAEPAGHFDYAWDQNAFLDAMAYFYLDRFQNYVQTTLGITNAANYAIPVDPQGVDGDDNSHYMPGGGGHGYVAFGGGLGITASNPVPDAADGMVVLHEYGHAVQDNANPGFDNPLSGIGEGFGDFLAAVFYDDKHAVPSATRGFMMSWDSEMGLGSWSGRRYDVAWLFDGPEYNGSGDNHIRGQLWCATMFELFRKFGGDSAYESVRQTARDLIIRLHLMANFTVPTHNGTAAQMGQQVELADGNLGGWRYPDGLHAKVIYDTYRRRHLSGYPDKAVDVYVDDGRNGGYGSTSGNDLFTETLWQDVFWETQDIWVRTTPYADAAAQAAGTPADHVEPPVGSTAYLYVRVKNKGTNAAGSGAVTVRAYHADPGIGLTWPNDWLPMDTPSVTVPNVLPGTVNAVVVGPFPWTPSVVGHECAFAIVECANDRAITQDLAPGSHVAEHDLVPFDNNVAQRNLAPTMAKKGGKFAFTVHNPYETASVMELQIASTLPTGWTHELSHGERIELKPNERRRIAITLNPNDTPEPRKLGTNYALRVNGVIEGQLIGGMTFYLAPPTAFPAAGRSNGTTHHHPTSRSEGRILHDVLEALEHDRITEAEIDIRLRFQDRNRH